MQDDILCKNLVRVSRALVFAISDELKRKPGGLTHILAELEELERQLLERWQDNPAEVGKTMEDWGLDKHFPSS